MGGFRGLDNKCGILLGFHEDLQSTVEALNFFPLFPFGFNICLCITSFTVTIFAQFSCLCVSVYISQVHDRNFMITLKEGLVAIPHHAASTLCY